MPFGLPFFGGIGLPSSSVSSAVVLRETFVEPAVAVVIVEREHEFVSVAERPCADGLGSFSSAEARSLAAAFISATVGSCVPLPWPSVGAEGALGREKPVGSEQIVFVAVGEAMGALAA